MRLYPDGNALLDHPKCLCAIGSDPDCPVHYPKKKMKARVAKRKKSDPFVPETATDNDIREWLGMLELQEVWSGFQQGADIAGIRAALKTPGLKTGGWMPKGFLTLSGPRPEYAEMGAKETPTRDYPTRTRLNVQMTDATIRLATNFESSGERCTLKAIEEFNKPHYDVPVYCEDWQDHLSACYRFLRSNQVIRLNIAGNASRAIECWVEWFLRQLFSQVRGTLNINTATPHHVRETMPFGNYAGKRFKEIPVEYLKDSVENLPNTETGLLESIHRYLIESGEMK